MAATLVASMWALIAIVVAGVYEYAYDHNDIVRKISDYIDNKF